MTQYTKAVVEKADNDDDFIAVASTMIEDRHGEIIDQAGWDLKSYQKDPVIMWAHDHTEPAIGTATKIWVEGSGKRAKLMIQGKLHDVTDKARAIKELVKRGIIKSMSVGYGLIEADGNIHKEMELHEVSFVNVGANQQALATAFKSLTDAGFKKKTIAELGIPVDIIETMDKLKEDVEQLKTVVKAQQSVNPRGRKNQATRQRLSMLKVIARAADKLNEGKEVLPHNQKADLRKVIKRSTEILIRDAKKDL